MGWLWTPFNIVLAENGMLRIQQPFYAYVALCTLKEWKREKKAKIIIFLPQEVVIVIVLMAVGQTRMGGLLYG